MPKAAQGSAKSPTTGGSARTKNTRRGSADVDGSAASGAAKSAEPEGKPSTGAVKTDTAETDAEKETTAQPEPAEAAATAQRGSKTEAEPKTTVKSGTSVATGAPKSGGGDSSSSSSPKTSAFTRTTPLGQNAAGTDGASARTRTRPRPRPQPRPRPRTRTRTAEPRVSISRRLALRAKAGLRRVPGWWPLPLCLVLGAGAGATYSAVTPAQYSAISYVVVSPAAGQSEAAGALGYAQAYGKIAMDPMILADAEKRARLRPGTIRQGIKASTSPDAPMVQITATSSNADQAAENADAVAKALSHTAKTSTKRTGARLTVLSEAMAPPTPVSPSAGVAVSVGACAGGLLGGLVLLVRPPSRRRPVAATAGADSGTEQAR